MYRLSKFATICGLITCIFFSFLPTNFLPAQDGDDQASRLYKKGLTAENLSEKIKLFESALALDPGHQEAIYQLGISFYQQESYAEAIEFLDRINRSDTTAFPNAKLYLKNAYTFFAQELSGKKDFNFALSNAQFALDIDPNYAPALTVLATIYCEQKIWQPCKENLDKSLALDPNQGAAWNLFGDLYFQQAVFYKAIDAYEHALALEPELKKAKIHLRIAKERNRPDAWLNRFEDAINRGELDEGLAVLQRAQELYPNHNEIESKWQTAVQARNYFAGLKAMEQNDWHTAFELLQAVNPEYRDAALKLEEVRAEIIFAESDSFITENENLPESNEIVEQTEKVAEIADNRKTKNDRIEEPPVTDAANFQNLIASKEPVIAEDSAANSAEILEKQFEVTSSQNSESRHSLNFIRSPFSLGILVGILFFGLVVLTLRKRKNSNQPIIKKLKSIPRINLNTEELFQDKLASETPVKFDPVNTGELFDSGGAQQLQTPLSLLDTKTISGGGKKIRLVGRYIIEKEIGRGSMGLIYKAWDPMLDRTVVIKQMAFEGNRNSAEVKRLRERLYREARAAGKLNHPNIVIIYDIEEDKGTSYIVMEYVEGRNLQDLLDDEKYFAPARVVKIVSQVCDALDFAHQHDIIHRDIKPSNILLRNGDKVKVADFGIAKLPQFGTLTQTGSVVGTPSYMSPEQIEGRKLDNRSDLFSVGVLLYEMLTGTRPFQGEHLPAIVYNIIHKDPPPPSQKNQGLPDFIDAIMAKALAKDTKDRYASVKELTMDLVKFEGKLLQNDLQ